MASTLEITENDGTYTSPIIYYPTKNPDTGEDIEIECKILWNADSDYGMQLIAVNPVEAVILGCSSDGTSLDDQIPENTPEGYDFTSNFGKAKWSYNHAIETLNQKAEAYINTTLSPANGARCVGSDPANRDLEGGDFETSYSYMNNKGGSSAFKDISYYPGKTTKIYTTDYNQLQKIERAGYSNVESYWLASRYASVSYSVGIFALMVVNNTGTTSEAGLIGDFCIIRASSPTTPGGSIESKSREYGLRPVFTIKSDARAIPGTGDKIGTYILSADES